jgi:hypothetical protein
MSYGWGGQSACGCSAGVSESGEPFGTSCREHAATLRTIQCMAGRHGEACTGPPETEEHLVPPCYCSCHNEEVGDLE